MKQNQNLAVIDADAQNVTRILPDWQAIGRDYRSGILSNREIGAMHGVSEGAIRKKAKKEGWERDLNARVQDKANALVRNHEVRTQYALAAKVSEQQTVNAGAQILADVKIEMKKSIGRLGTLAEALLAELEAQTVDPALLEQFGQMMRSPNEYGQDKLNDLYQKIISTPGRVDTTKKLAETLRIYVAMQRETWGIDKPTEPDESSTGFAAMLRDMKRSTLPIVYDVPPDEHFK